MGCKSAIYCVNTNFGVAANGNIPFGSVIRRFGQCVELSGSDIVCCGQGYYDVDVHATLVPAATGTIGIQLYADGQPVPGAIEQGSGTASEPLPLSMSPMVRQKGSGATSLSLRLVTPDGVATGATATNVTAKVKKL